MRIKINLTVLKKLTKFEIYKHNYYNYKKNMTKFVQNIIKNINS